MIFAVNQHLIDCPISPRSGNEGVEMGLTSLLITFSGLLAKLFLPIPMLLSYNDSET